jgi:pSer/pThr/pTyr-binding forkhead associated (FHA) protein
VGIRVWVRERSGARTEHVFDKAAITIGRVAGNDIVLARGNVARRHLAVVERDGKLLATVQRSATGTFVEGLRLTHPYPVQDDERIYIGDFTLGFEITGPRPWAYPTELVGEERGQLLILASRDRGDPEHLVASLQRPGEELLRLREIALGTTRAEHLEQRLAIHRELGHPRILPLARDWSDERTHRVLTRERVGVDLDLLVDRARREGGRMPEEIMVDLFSEVVHAAVDARELVERWPLGALRARELFLGEDGYLRVAPDYGSKARNQGGGAAQQAGRVGDRLLRARHGGFSALRPHVDDALAGRLSLDELRAAYPEADHARLADFLASVAGDVLDQQRALIEQLNLR